MNEKSYLSLDFWMAIVGTLVMVLIALGVIGEGTGEDVKALAAPLIAAVLPIVIFILSRFHVRAAAVRNGLLAGDKPAWPTVEFWMTAVSTVAMVFVALRVVDRATADSVIALAAPFVAAVLPILAYLLGHAWEQAAALSSAALRGR